MPLFGSKFSPKRGQPRKSPSLSNLNLDASEKAVAFGVTPDVPIELNLGGNTKMVFDKESAKWTMDSAARLGSDPKQMNNVQKENKKLSEENNLLKLKIEILLDMLAETTGEVHLQENEIFQLQKQIKTK